MDYIKKYMGAGEWGPKGRKFKERQGHGRKVQLEKQLIAESKAGEFDFETEYLCCRWCKF